jgi:hypothetical protein
MSDLQSYFAGFLEALEGGSTGALERHMTRPEATSRLAVYRNTAFKGQADALMSAYPSVAAALGPTRFVDLARAYIGAHPATMRSFALYGAGLAELIAAQAPDAETLALADFAALDRAWLEAHCAADAPHLEPAALAEADLARTALFVHPSTHCVALRFDAYGYWAALRAGAPTPKTIPATASFALVWRRGFDVEHRAVTAGESAFFLAIQAGAPLALAVEAGSCADDGFEPASVFAGMLTAGVFSAVWQTLETGS